MKKKESEHYLTKEQLEYFRGKLLNWKAELLKESDVDRETLEGGSNEADIFDLEENTVIENETTESDSSSDDTK